MMAQTLENGYESRRPIRSRTYTALLHLFSNYHTLSPSTNLQGDDNDVQVRQGSECDTSAVEFRQISDQNATSNYDQTKSIVELADRPNHKELGGHTARETGLDNIKVITEQIKVPESDQVNLVTTDVLMDDCDLEMGEFSSIDLLDFNGDFSVDDFADALNFSFGDDMDVESSKAGDNSGDVVSNLPENVFKESVDRLQLKEMELEKMLASPCMKDSFGCVGGEADTEEGEISDNLLDELSEDALGDKSTGSLHVTEGNVCKDSNPSALNTINSNGDSNTEELKAITMPVHDQEPQNVICERDKEATKISPMIPSLSSFGRILEENVAGNQISTAVIQDANEKKRKKGPMTEERKAKKKKNKRIKRAEKNRELGVKRLKLPPPVLKPKTVKHCRHYLLGRCHEGEKCKFSHDVVPLTKAKPCAYFARQSCMKGDDCPFDHELSKYPCNNYATNGFCGRGSDCLFSHKILANQSSPLTPSASNPEKRGSRMNLDELEPYVKLARPLINLNSGGKTDSCGVFPTKLNDAKLKSGGNSSVKKVEQVSESAKPAKKIPKGVSFILHEGIPCGDPNKQRDEIVPTPGGNTDSQKTPLNEPISANKSNDVSVVGARRMPRGINFLSFTRTSLDDANCKKLSNLFSSGYDGKEKQSLVSSEGGKIVEASTQVTENVRELLEERSSNVSLVTMPFPVNSSGKTQLYDSVNAKICSSLKTSASSNKTSLVQKAVQSTLAFAAKFESSIKIGHSQ